MHGAAISIPPVSIQPPLSPSFSSPPMSVRSFSSPPLMDDYPTGSQTTYTLDSSPTSLRYDDSASSIGSSASK